MQTYPQEGIDDWGKGTEVLYFLPVHFLYEVSHQEQVAKHGRIQIADQHMCEEQDQLWMRHI